MNGKYVTYTNHWGLANRLRLHCVAYAYARKTGRQLVLTWRRNRFCHARYHDLFVGGPPSLGALTLRERVRIRLARGLSCRTFGKGTLPEGRGIDFIPDSHHTLIHLHHDLEASMHFGSRLGDFHEDVVRSMIPRPEVQERATPVLAEFDGPTVGIHVRRGDFFRYLGDEMPPIERFVAIIQETAKLIPDATFFIASDGSEEDLKPVLNAGNCVIRPRVTARGRLEGIRDALADLLILAATDFVVSTPKSSFGGFAAYILGGKPIVRADAGWRSELDQVLKSPSLVRTDAAEQGPS
ncbi:hypothetical protein ACFL3S_00960 [Gemmatimonadota bacterium]